MFTIKQIISENVKAQNLYDICAQSSKMKLETASHLGETYEFITFSGKGKNPDNWDEIQAAAEKYNVLVVSLIEETKDQSKIAEIQNAQKLARKRKIVASFTLFALFAIGGFASFANISNVFHLVGNPTLGEAIASVVFGLYLSFCFAYFALLGEHSKSRTTAYLLGLDVVSHFLVSKNIVSFDNQNITVIYVLYYAIQLVISMEAVAKLAKNENFMFSFFGKEA